MIGATMTPPATGGWHAGDSIGVEIGGLAGSRRSQDDEMEVWRHRWNVHVVAHP